MIGFTRKMELDEQRYDRFKETIHEYLGDEGNDPQDLIRDLKRACVELKEYHAERLAAYNTVEESVDGIISSGNTETSIEVSE